MRDAFARFVPENVVSEVLDRTGDGLRLGGREVEVTILFSDLRGFTSFSESRDPGSVIEILNRYLSTRTDAIMDNGGTLVSYMGDGIMAVFGAPLEQRDHADRALATAREMTGARLVEFNEWMRGEDLGEGFRMGVGLNTGPVMAGNVGSERRMEYTTIGDTTNTASRLEGMTKGTSYMVYLGESTRAALPQCGRSGVRGGARGSRPRRADPGMGAGRRNRTAGRADRDGGRRTARNLRIRAEGGDQGRGLVSAAHELAVKGS